MDLIELFDERAAIRQYDAGMSRAQAEWATYQDFRQRFGRENLPQSLHQAASAAANLLLKETK
jgi:hypothetical protein